LNFRDRLSIRLLVQENPTVTQRLLSVYRTYFPDPQGGLQEAIRQICLATKRFDVQNKIFTLSPSPAPQTLERPEAQVVRYRSWAAPASCDISDPRAFLAFARLTEQSDLLHYFFPWPFGDLLHQVTRPKPPAVMTYVSDVVRQKLLGQVYRPLMESTFKGMRTIIANAPGYVDSSPILSRPDIRRKLEIIPLGIDETSYPQSMDISILQRLGLGDEPFFVFVGVLRYYKGLQFLIEAAKKVNAKIVIAGSGPEGAALADLVSRSGAQNIVFAGQVSDEEKLALISHSVALVLPSHLRSEAYGMVLVEAAMRGKPMISCEIGTGTSYVNKHLETGLVVEPESAVALSRAMLAILEDAPMAKEMGINARKRYELLFSGQALGKAYASVYANACRLG
jgi:glycosyltransferase involved in cell wall biosynthesis